jgi:hypothetical protein
MAIDRFAQLCLWTDESIALSRELQDLLCRERLALIHLRGEELAEITMSKEVLVRRIVDSRRRLRESGKAWFGVESSSELEALLLAEQKPVWAEKQKLWLQTWKDTCEQAERSQLFLQHSQRNLGRLVEHWRRLIGEAPLYSASGRKVDAPSTGRVLQAKY